MINVIVMIIFVDKDLLYKIYNAFITTVDKNETEACVTVIL